MKLTNLDYDFNFSVHPEKPFKFHSYYAAGWKTDNDIGLIFERAWAPAVFIGGHKIQDNFKYTYLVGLDFDGGWPIECAYETFKDYNCIVAPSRSHRIAKGKKPPADRFRVVLSWDEPIYDFETYFYNLRMLGEKYPYADRACLEPARYFQPCRKEGAKYFNGKSLKWETPPKPVQSLRTSSQIKADYQSLFPGDKLPKQLFELVHYGKLLYYSQNSRDKCFFSAAKWMFKLGKSEDFIVNALLSAPIDRDHAPDGSRQKFSDTDIKKCIRSAKKYI